jgi:hypothetical protein
VGDEAAKVLRELGERVKTMTRLSSPNILAEVHHAVEELQKKIDQRSFLLVNTERWGEAVACKRQEGAGKDNEPSPPPPEHAVVINIGAAAVHKSDSSTSLARHAVLTNAGASSLHKSDSNTSLARFDSSASTSGTALALDISAFKPQSSWPFRLPPLHPGLPFEAAEARTYESASALSLATFASLLIEFVARLRNLVDAFEELSDKAGFKDIVEEPFAAGGEEGGGGFVDRMRRFFRLKR